MAGPDGGVPVSPKRKSPRTPATPTSPNSAERDPRTSERSPRPVAPPSTSLTATAGLDGGESVSPKRKSPRRPTTPPTPTSPNSAEMDARAPTDPRAPASFGSTERSAGAMPPPSTGRMATRLSSKLTMNEMESQMEVDLESRRGSDVEMAGCSRRDSDVEMGGPSSAALSPSSTDLGASSTDLGASPASAVTPRRRLRAPILPEPEIDMAAARLQKLASSSSKAGVDMEAEAEAVAVTLGEAEAEWKTPLVWWTGPNLAPGALNDDKPHLTSIIYGSWDKIYVWPGGRPKAAEVRALTQAMAGAKKPGNGGESPDSEKGIPEPYPGGLQPMKIPERLVFTPPNKLEAILFVCKNNCNWDWDQLAPVKVHHSQTISKVLLCHMVNQEADVNPALNNTACACRATPLVDKFVILPINEEYLLFYHRYNHLEYSEEHPNDAFLLHKGLPSALEINHQLEGLEIKKRDGKGTFFAKYA